MTEKKQLQCSKMVVRELQAQGSLGKLPARLYRLVNAEKPAPGLIVFFHQGGFVGGSLDECDEFVRALALRAGLPVLAAVS